MHVKGHQKACGSTRLAYHIAKDALVNVELSETSVPTTPNNVDHASCGDSNQEGYMVASADLPSPLVAIGGGSKKSLEAGAVMAKSGGDPDGTLPHANQQTPRITGE